MVGSLASVRVNLVRAAAGLGLYDTAENGEGEGEGFEWRVGGGLVGGEDWRGSGEEVRVSIGAIISSSSSNHASSSSSNCRGSLRSRLLSTST